MRRTGAMIMMVSVLMAGCVNESTPLPDKTTEYEITSISTYRGAYGYSDKRISLTANDDISDTLCIRIYKDYFNKSYRVGTKVKVNPRKLSENRHGLYKLCE